MEFGQLRRVTSLRQLEILVEGMEGNRELALGRVRSKEARALSLRLWSGLAKRLNAEGAKRSAREWTKCEQKCGQVAACVIIFVRVWNDYKCKVRGKLMQRRRGYSTGGSSTEVVFTPLEERVASLISRDSGFSGVQKDPIEVDNDSKTGILRNNSSTMDSVSNQFNSVEESQDEVEVNIQHLSPSPTLDEESFEASSPTEHQLPKRENTNEFNEAWASINHIEEQRARTERIQATANLKQAEAALKNAEAMQSFAQSLRLIAKCVHRFTNFATEKH